MNCDVHCTHMYIYIYGLCLTLMKGYVTNITIYIRQKNIVENFVSFFYIYLVGQKVSLISIHVLRKIFYRKEEMHVEYKLDCPLYVLV